MDDDKKLTLKEIEEKIEENEKIEGSLQEKKIKWDCIKRGILTYCEYAFIDYQNKSISDVLAESVIKLQDIEDRYIDLDHENSELFDKKEKLKYGDNK